MKMSEYLNKKKYLLIITSIIIVIIIIASIIIFTKNNNKSDKIIEDDLKVEYKISKNNTYPMDIDTAEWSNIYIKNNTNKDIEYVLTFKEQNDSSLDLSKVYIYINNNLYKLSDFETGRLLTDKLKSGSETTISFKTFIGLDLIDENDDDKILDIKYDVHEKR